MKMSNENTTKLLTLFKLCRKVKKGSKNRTSVAGVTMSYTFKYFTIK